MSSSSTGSEGSEHKSEVKESLAEIRARALRESAELRKQKADAAAAPPPTAASVPVPSQPAVQQQQVAQQPQQQQRVFNEQQANQIAANAQQQGYVGGFIAAVIICTSVFVAYKGVTWVMSSSAKTAAAPARVAARAAAAVPQ